MLQAILIRAYLPVGPQCRVRGWPYLTFCGGIASGRQGLGSLMHSLKGRSGHHLLADCCLLELLELRYLNNLEMNENNLFEMQCIYVFIF